MTLCYKGNGGNKVAAKPHPSSRPHLQADTLIPNEVRNLDQGIYITIFQKVNVLYE